MGIFTRFKDIVASNMNAMLDRAEDPEKLIKLMIREMEDTLIEIKSSCAGTIATRTKTGRILEAARQKEKFWAQKAELAVNKGRDDLARQALKEKMQYAGKAQAIEEQTMELDAIIDQYKQDIQELEDKLRSAREKQRILVQRHIRAKCKKDARQEIRRAGSAEAMQKFEEFENHIERLEARADIIDWGSSTSLEEEFKALEGNDIIDAELEKLKSSRSGKKNDITETQQ